MLFGDRLKMLREEKDITQKEVGNAVGVSDRIIGYYESNDRFPKDENILKKIADFFDVSVDYLLGRTDIRKSHSSSGFTHYKPTQTVNNPIEKETINPKFRLIIDSLDRAGDLQDEDIEEIGEQVEFLINLKRKKKSNS